MLDRATRVSEALKVPVQWFDTIDSTNDYLLARDELEPAVVIADHQQAGKGRRGKQWQTPQGNLAVSVRMSFPHIDQVSVIPLWVAIELASEMQRYVPSITVKWPNDLLVDGAKLAGILVESVIRGKTVSVVIGIGLNHRTLPELSDRPDITSLERLGVSIDDVALATKMAAASIRALERAELDEVESAFASVDVLQGRRVKVSGEETFEGVAQGVGGQGQLIVATRSGLQSLWSANASVRLL